MTKLIVKVILAVALACAINLVVDVPSDAAPKAAAATCHNNGWYCYTYKDFSNMAGTRNGISEQAMNLQPWQRFRVTALCGRYDGARAAYTGLWVPRGIHSNAYCTVGFPFLLSHSHQVTL